MPCGAKWFQFIVKKLCEFVLGARIALHIERMQALIARWAGSYTSTELN